MTGSNQSNTFTTAVSSQELIQRNFGIKIHSNEEGSTEVMLWIPEDFKEIHDFLQQGIKSGKVPPPVSITKSPCEKFELYDSYKLEKVEESKTYVAHNEFDIDFRKVTTALHQQLTDGYNYHLMHYYSMVCNLNKNRFDSFFNMLSPGISELSLSHISRIFDPKTKIWKKRFLQLIQQHASCFKFGECSKVKREIETDLIFFDKTKSDNRINNTLDKIIEHLRNKNIGHIDPRKLSATGIQVATEVSLAEINELYNFAFYILNKYWQYWSGKRLKICKQHAELYKNSAGSHSRY